MIKQQKLSHCALRVGLSLLASAITLPAFAEDAYPPQKLGETKPATDKWTGYRGVAIEKFDFTKAPRCGVKGLSREEKIERNVRMAEYIYQIYVDAAKHDTLRYTYSGPIGGVDCFDDGGSIIMGLAKTLAGMPRDGFFLTPKRTPQQIEDERKQWEGGRSVLQLEIKMLKSKYPDWSAVPGSFRIVSAWEDGVSYILELGGTNKADGYQWKFWEMNTFLFNDEGRVWHYDEVIDTRGFEEGIHRGWGKRMDEFSYMEMIREMDAKKSATSK
jgi:hypothetical protein